LYLACTKNSYNIEQALALLYWHKHDCKLALQDMEIYVPQPDEWTQEDKIIFEQAFMYHGKNFNKIKQVVSDNFSNLFYWIS
jgi:hypothetical protein